MSKFQHIFFDLDSTLWDFEANSQDELLAIFKDFRLVNYGISLPLEFVKIYKHFNEICWEAYIKGDLTQAELRYKRFNDTLNYFGVYEIEMAKKMGERYVERSPYRTRLIEYTTETLEYLFSKGYQLHIITNGFEDVQHIKLAESKLKRFFKTMTTSEMAHSKKPEIKIFEFALNQTGAKRENSVYIGDDLLVDIEGANNAGIASIYYNPNKKLHQTCTFLEISSLKELQDHF